MSGTDHPRESVDVRYEKVIRERSSRHEKRIQGSDEARAVRLLEQ